MSRQTPVFIINPIAGGNKKDTKQIIEAYLQKHGFSAVVETTKQKDHGKELTNEYLAKGYRHFVAVGGDGTINEVASQLINKEGSLSIIPLGSGNGLSRTLNIPMDMQKALDVVFSGKEKVIDVGMLNDLPFFCTSGVGFDAYCADKFANGKHNRGFWNYVKIIFSSYLNYKINTSLFCKQERSFFSISFANATQFGNNAYIAPDAKMDDGELDCVIIEKHPKWYGLVLGFLLMTGKIRNSKYVDYFRGTTFTLEQKENFVIHIDGEYVPPFTNNIAIKTLPKALKLIV